MAAKLENSQKKVLERIYLKYKVSTDDYRKSEHRPTLLNLHREFMGATGCTEYDADDIAAYMITKRKRKQWPKLTENGHGPGKGKKNGA